MSVVLSYYPGSLKMSNRSRTAVVKSKGPGALFPCTLHKLDLTHDTVILVICLRHSTSEFSPPCTLSFA